jgi:hypothetical protein
MSWLAYALISAVAAAATAILAKLGVEGVPSTLATAIRTVVVTVFAWAMVFALSELRVIGGVTRRTLVFLVLSGIATGVSWLAYFRALQMAPGFLGGTDRQAQSPVHDPPGRALVTRAADVASGRESDAHGDRSAPDTGVTPLHRHAKWSFGSLPNRNGSENRCTWTKARAATSCARGALAT